jgi:outer membrane protein assembly factor BamB
MRSRRVVAPPLLLAVLATGCWSQFRYDASHTGFNSFDTSISRDAVSTSMVLDWTLPTGGPIVSSPALFFPTPGAGGTLGGPGVVYVGSGDGKLYALDAQGNTNCTGSLPKTCRPLWTAAAGDGFFVTSSPAVSFVNGSEARVFVGSYGNNLYAFDAAGTKNCGGSVKTCAPLMTAPTGGHVNSSPTLTNNRVYVGSGDGKLYAFDAAGATNCSAGICQPLLVGLTGGAINRSSPAVAGDKAYVGSTDGKLYAFDANGANNCGGGTTKTCFPLWTASTGFIIDSSPAVANGIVYVGSQDGKLYAFDAATGAPIWRTSYTGGSVLSSPAVANGIVYVGSEGGNLRAFDATGSSAQCSGTGAGRTCNPLWTAITGTIPPNAVDSSPAVANGVVYVGSNEDDIYAFDAAGNVNCSTTGGVKTCASLWSAPTGNFVLSSPAVGAGMVIVGSNDGKLYGFGLERVAPTCSVVVPGDGATLSGTTILDASASDNVKVSRVEFHLTGGNSNDSVIGSATAGPYGWAYNWNTTTVANGSYTLSCVAFDPALNSGRSLGIGVTVHN